MEHSVIVITWRQSVTPRKLKLCLGSKVPLVEKCKSRRHEQSQRQQGIKPELQRKNHPALTVIWKNLEESCNPYPYILSMSCYSSLFSLTRSTLTLKLRFSNKVMIVQGIHFSSLWSNPTPVFESI